MLLIEYTLPRLYLVYIMRMHTNANALATHTTSTLPAPIHCDGFVSRTTSQRKSLNGGWHAGLDVVDVHN